MNRLSKALLAVVLAASITLSGCSSSWIDTAVKDLPIVLQVVTDVLSIVAVAQGHGQISAGEAAAIQAVSAQATADLQLIQDLVAAYKNSPTATTLAKIQAAIGDAQTNLQAILTAAHIKDPATAAAITAAVGLAMTTLLAIESLLPTAQASSSRHARKGAPQLPNPDQLQAQLNQILRNSGYGNLAR
jgi:hypothetical protein